MRRKHAVSSFQQPSKVINERTCRATNIPDRYVGGPGTSTNPLLPCQPQQKELLHGPGGPKTRAHTPMWRRRLASLFVWGPEEEWIYTQASLWRRGRRDLPTTS